MNEVELQDSKLLDRVNSVTEGILRKLVCWSTGTRICVFNIILKEGIALELQVVQTEKQS